MPQSEQIYHYRTRVEHNFPQAIWFGVPGQAAQAACTVEAPSVI